MAINNILKTKKKENTFFLKTRIKSIINKRIKHHNQIKKYKTTKKMLKLLVPNRKMLINTIFLKIQKEIQKTQLIRINHRQ